MLESRRKLVTHKALETKAAEICGVNRIHTNNRKTRLQNNEIKNEEKRLKKIEGSKKQR